MRIVVIDAQGGGIGRQVVSALKKSGKDMEITAVGTNTAATSAMIKAGADKAATGENSVKVAVRDTDYIIGPVGIVIADSLLGEITEGMAAAISRSSAKRLLIPINNCNNMIFGVKDMTISSIVDEIVNYIN